MSKHTKGPWEWTQVSKTRIKIKEPIGVLIAECPYSEKFAEESEATAQLISLAPTMLNSIRLIEDLSASMSGSNLIYKLCQAVGDLAEGLGDIEANNEQIRKCTKQIREIIKEGKIK